MRSGIVLFAFLSNVFVNLHGCGGTLNDGYSSDSYGEAAFNAALAATLWVTAGGCKIKGCLPDMRCNRDTELCEPIEQPDEPRSTSDPGFVLPERSNDNQFNQP